MMLKRVPLPRLLKKELNSDGRTLKEQGRLHCDPDITLNMQPLSTVQISVPEHDLEPAMHDLVEVYNIHGSVGIYRVVDIQPAYFKNRSMTLNHALDVLHDCLYPAEEKFSGTVTAYLTALLACQKQKIGNLPYWQLGTVEDTGTWTQELSYDNVLDLVKEIPETHQDFMYTYDFGTFPWTLNLVRRPDTVLTEFRAGRNIESCKVTTNDQGMCNRLYLSVTTHTGSGKTEKTNTTIEVHNDIESQQNGDFGIIENSAGIDTQQVTNKAAWIADYFERHNAPYVQISVDGNDLKEQTGVGIDEMHLGYLCRTVLPKYRTIFNERIVSVRYPSAIRTPSRVNVSMANKKQTAEDSIASARKEAAKASKSAGGTKIKANNNAATIEENTVRYNRMLEETDKRVTSTMTATGVLLDENNEPLVGPDGLYVFDTTGPGAALSSRVTQTAGLLQTEVETRTRQGQTLSSAITQTANKISQIVTEVGADGTVTTASIVTAINNHKSSIKLNADTINLEGYVTATQLDTRLINVDQLFTQTGYAGTIYAANVSATGTVSARTGDFTNNVYARNYYVTDAAGNTDYQLGNAVTAFGTATASGGQISIPFYTSAHPSSSSTPAGTINFNIADTQYYQDGVSAARAGVTMSAGGWVYNSEEGELTNYITATNGQSLEISQPTVSISVSGGYAYAYVHDKNGGRHTAARVEVSTGGIRSSSMTGSSNSSSDMSTWQSDADNTLSLSAKYGLITVIPNSGSAYDIAVNASGTYNAGWNGLITAANGSSASSYVQYSGKSAYNASLTRSGKTITGYIWLKNASGTWVRTREISIQAATTTTRVYYIGNDGDYYQYPAGKVIYTW